MHFYNFHVFMVFSMSMFFLIGLVRNMQSIAHSGWFTRRALLSWIVILICCPILIFFGYESATQLPSERWGAGLALGVIVATILLATGVVGR
jgi:hypothetical protein